nr:adhesion G-protein coupled receptor D1-like isoform X1 [Halyomorpha halys]
MKMQETCLLWVLSCLTSLSASAIKRGWVTEIPVPLSSAPAPPLGAGPTPSLNASTASSTLTNSSAEEEDYYSPYPDYPDLLLNSSQEDRKLLEDPLPDNSLADTDLHDHDRIDSVMYIYFGGNSRQDTPPGRQVRPQQHTVLIVSAVIGLIGQLLTLAGALRKVKCKDPSLIIIINTELALTLSNVIFMLGVQATSDRSQCELVAMILHYLHLVASSWFSANSVYLYQKLRDPGSSPRLLVHFFIAWSLPALAVYLSRLVERPGYESRDYCWMSVERGMVFSFMAPLSLLMIMNTGLSVAGLQLAGKADEVDRKSLRVAASLLPLFAVSWFLGVLALENSSSLVFPLLFLASHGFLNWFIFICWLPGEAGSWRDSEEEEDDEEEELIYEEVKAGLDDQPLLFPRDELQMDPICTISS